jgi:hypothetical protein
MRLSKVAALVGLATPIIGSSLPSNENEQKAEAVIAVAAEPKAMVKLTPSNKPALVARQAAEITKVDFEYNNEDNTEQQDAQKLRELAFAENFFNALATFIQNDVKAEHANTTDISTAPLVLAINATINNMIFPQNLTVTWTNSSEPKIEPRQRGNPYAWEFSGGRRKPPCPGWPARQKYNSTHWVEWYFFQGYQYGLLDLKCELSNGLAAGGY